MNKLIRWLLFFLGTSQYDLLEGILHETINEDDEWYNINLYEQPKEILAITNNVFMQVGFFLFYQRGYRKADVFHQKNQKIESGFDKNSYPVIFVGKIMERKFTKNLTSIMTLRYLITKRKFSSFNAKFILQQSNRKWTKPNVVRAPDMKTPMCNECGRTFNIKNNLLRHLKNVHDSSKVQCDLCDKTLKQSSHTYQQHLNENP